MSQYLATLSVDDTVSPMPITDFGRQDPVITIQSQFNGAFVKNLDDISIIVASFLVGAIMSSTDADETEKQQALNYVVKAALEHIKQKSFAINLET